MHPRTEEILRHLDANRVVLRAAVDVVPIGYQWLIFVGSHEARHADQIREAGSTLA